MKEFKNGQLVEVFTPSGIWSERVYIGLNGRLHVVALNDNGGALSHFYDTHVRAMPIKKKGWINIYSSNDTGQHIHSSKALAIAAAAGSESLQATIEIEWEEQPDCMVTP